MLLRRVRTLIPAGGPNRRLSAAAAKENSSENASKSQKALERSRETLMKRLMRLVIPISDAEKVLTKWKKDGRPIRSRELTLTICDLRKHRRYQQALQACEWRTKQNDIRLQPGDYALHLDLVAKVCGIGRAEKFLEEIPSSMRNHSAYAALLHCYVQKNLPDKAESLIAKMLESGLVKNPRPYNHMLSLYIANGRLEKVPELIREMKKSVSPNVVTYNWWLTYCARMNDAVAAKEVFSELKKVKLQPNWVTYGALATLFANNGSTQKAMDSLKEMERLASRKDRAAYAALLRQYTNIGDKAGVRAVWNKMKTLFRKPNDNEYGCMINSLMKLSELKEAEELYTEWKSVTGSKHSRVGNPLLEAYVNGDKMKTASEFLERMTENGMKASYTALELLTRGYLKLKEGQKAAGYFESALNLAKRNPDEKLVREVFAAVEEEGNIEMAEKLLFGLRNSGYSTTAIYNSVLRTYAKAGKMPLLVEERMRKDNVPMDRETRHLVKITSKMCVSEVPSTFLKS